MLENIKQTIKHTGIYALGNISAKLVGFILLPIYTKHIPVAAYGIWGLLELIDVMSVHILSVGLPQALLRWYGLEDEEIRKRNYVFSQFIFLLIICIVSVIIVGIFRTPLSQIIFSTTIYQDLLVFLFIAISFTILSKIPLSLLRLEDKSLAYSICIVSQFTLNLILNIWFIAFLKWGVKGILISYMISSGCVFLFLLLKMIRYLNAKFEMEEMVKMIQFSYPFIFSAIGATIISMGNRYLLKYLGTFTDVGIFTLGYKFSNVLKIFLIDAFSLGLPIIGWHVIKTDQNPKRFLSKTMTYLMFVSLWIALGIATFSKGIIHRFAQSPDYWSAASLIPILILGVVLIGMHRILFFILQIPKKTQYIPIIVCCASLMNIAINFMLIPRYGVSGSAYATLISYFLMNGLAYLAAQKFYPIKYEIKRLIILFAVTVVLYCITLLLNWDSLFFRILCKGIVIFSFPWVLYVIRFYESIELYRIREFSQKYRKLLFR